MMEEKNWYIYQNQKQEGPFNIQKIKAFLNDHMLSSDAYLFQVGWKEWRPLEDCSADLQMTIPPAFLATRKERAPRASVSGRIIVHNDQQLMLARGVNISPTGIFVETQENIFILGSTVKLTCQIENAPFEPFHVVARVIRFSKDSRFATGYGMKFENLDLEVAGLIQKFINHQNHKKSA